MPNRCVLAIASRKIDKNWRKWRTKSFIFRFFFFLANNQDRSSKVICLTPWFHPILLLQSVLPAEYYYFFKRKLLWKFSSPDAAVIFLFRSWAAQKTQPANPKSMYVLKILSHYVGRRRPLTVAFIIDLLELNPTLINTFLLEFYEMIQWWKPLTEAKLDCCNLKILRQSPLFDSLSPLTSEGGKKMRELWMIHNASLKVGQWSFD